MPVPTDYLAKMAQCEMAARFAPEGVAEVWRSAADCYMLLADIAREEHGAPAAPAVPHLAPDILPDAGATPRPAQGGKPAH